MAATAMTPSAMHSTKTVRPPAPARSSRKAIASASGRRQPRAGPGVAMIGGGHDAAARRLAPPARDAAVGEADDAVAALGERAVMGDEQERGAGALLQREQKVHDFGAGGLVEIAGRLVGEDEGGLWRERPGHGDALLLAAGELAREMRLAMG